VFDIRSNSWRQLTFKMPSARAFHGLEAIDDNVYLFGGYDDEEEELTLNSTEAFSLKDGKGRRGAP